MFSDSSGVHHHSVETHTAVRQISITDSFTFRRWWELQTNEDRNPEGSDGVSLMKLIHTSVIPALIQKITGTLEQRPLPSIQTFTRHVHGFWQWKTTFQRRGSFKKERPDPNWENVVSFEIFQSLTFIDRWRSSVHVLQTSAPNHCYNHLLASPDAKKMHNVFKEVRKISKSLEQLLFLIMQILCHTLSYLFLFIFSLFNHV